MDEAEVVETEVVVESEAKEAVTPTCEMSEAGFPGEGEQKEPEAAKVDAKVGPWMVAIVNEELIENGVVAILDIIKCELSLQVEADQWIKDNANEGEVYMSLRRGNAFRAKVVRKLEEI